MLQAERAPRGKGFQIGLQAQVAVVRVHAFGPPVAHLLFHRPAPKPQPRPVEKNAPGVLAGHPDHHRGCIGQLAKPPLAVLPPLPVAQQLRFQLRESAAQTLHALDLTFRRHCGSNPEL